ncbi:MAG: DUF3299 domain-containing protein [Burkholderiales bacterium]|nr:DUF3299 domain-containing protein [Burkholderiales bacterium]
MLMALSAQADTPKQIMWQDLTPGTAKAEDDPFSAMSLDQLSDLSDLAWIRDRRARGEKPTPKDQADEQALLSRLKQAGVDAEAMLTKRDEVIAQRQTQAVAVNAKLDGAQVRIPGYVLPLEYKGKQVAEFLLVPWVGACIHTPPPPPNQIIHVTPARPFESTGMFAAVWVTGQLSAASSKRALFMLDGSSDIDIAYSLKASVVEPYTE